MKAYRHMASMAVALVIPTFGASALAAPPKKPPTGPRIEAPGGVIINSTTTGATIEVDGKVMGTVPMEDSIVLMAGPHTLKVTLRGYGDYLDTFNVQAGEEVELEVDLMPCCGIVRINTADAGATVKIDSKVEGVTPFDKDIPVGKKLLLVTRPGFYDETRDLDVRAAETYNIDVTLRPLPTTSKGGDSSFYETWWFWTIVGVAAVGTGTAVALTAGGEATSPTPSFSLSIP